MNLKYLTTTLLPQREKEINEGSNLGTSNPIYVVFDLREHIVSGHSDYSSYTNMKDLDFEYGFIDEGLDDEEREFKLSDENMVNPIEVTRFYTDMFIAFFLTSKSAHEYLNYQSHNLNNPYVYVFHSGYRNLEMEMLFKK
jgi:hypothetical protein